MYILKIAGTDQNSFGPVPLSDLGNGKMMKNGPYLFKFSDFFISLRLLQKKFIVFCPSMMILIIIAAAIFHELLKITQGWVG